MNIQLHQAVHLPGEFVASPIRDNFFAAREFKSLEDLNNQAYQWCNTFALDRLCPEDREKTVREVFDEEQPKLISLPPNPYLCDEIEQVRVGKAP